MNDQDRQAFEKAVKQWAGFEASWLDRDCDGYVSHYVDEAWDACQMTLAHRDAQHAEGLPPRPTGVSRHEDDDDVFLEWRTPSGLVQIEVDNDGWEWTRFENGKVVERTDHPWSGTGKTIDLQAQHAEVMREVGEVLDLLEQHDIDSKHWQAWGHTYSPLDTTHPVHNSKEKLDAAAARLREKVGEVDHAG